MAMYNYTPNTNYYGANEEEERRRREQEQLAADDAARLAKLQMPAPPVVEQAGVPVAPVAPEPIKQTITYDPVSGEQRMKIEGNARDLSAENPLTPTLTMPGSVSPEQIDQQQQMEMAAQQREREAQMAQQAQMPQAQVPQPQQQMPQAQVPAPEQQMPQPQLPQPGPGVQVASVAPGLPQTQPAQPYTGPGQGEEAQTVGQAQPAPQQPPAPPATDPMAMFTAAVGDTAKLLQIYNDKNQSPELRRMAGREASRQLKAETEQVEAENKVKTMTPNEVQRELRKSDEEGSWTKRVIFGLLNMQGAMAAEDAKLGIGAKFQSINLNGQPVEIKVRADGKAMEGYNAQTLEPLSKKELVAATAQMTTLKGAEQGAQVYMDPTGTVKGTYVLERRPGQTPVYKEVGSGRIASGTESAALRQTGVQGTLADQSSRQLQELQNKLAFAGPTASATEIEKIFGESEARFGPLPEDYKARIRGGAPRPNVAAAPTGAAQAQAAAPGAPAGQAPAGQAQAQTQRAPAPVTAQAAPGGGVRLSVVPGGTPGARESAMRTNEAAAKERIQTGESIPREFIKLNTKAASDAAAASASAPQLLSTIDRISRTLEQRPDFANSLQSPAFTAFVVAQDSEKQKRLEDLSNAARIRPQDKTEFQSLVNDLRKLEVAGITQSGLTAAQLNTERESQRVIDALAANLRNTPQAARAQVEVARAQILYNQRFARYLANADPTQNPALLRSRFDDTIGDKIYQDLVPRLEAIKRGSGVVDFRSNQ